MMSRDESFEIERGDPLYPQGLEELSSPPERLFGIGNPKALSCACISAIGARRASPYGLAVASVAGRVAAECGLVLVSGGAMGCDSAASRAATEAGGRTVVVAGTGADVVYPRSSADVFEGAVSSGGAVVSLESWGSPPRRYAFPKRNRVIAALSRVTIVVEAGKRSGTMSTAEVAMGLGRILYAVPGSIFSPESVGTNELISDGANIICSERDLEACIALDYDRMRWSGADVPVVEGRVLSALLASPTRADELSYRLGESVVSVLATLADYESKGMVVRLRDGRYSPSAELMAASARIGREEPGGAKEENRG